jgi:protein pelota
LKVLYQNAKLGEIRLRADTLDDLWHLRHLVTPGDLVEARTYRRDDSATGDTSKPTRGDKRALTLGVRVESVEFQAFSDRLRISGKIETGPTDLGQYHTLTVEPRDDLKIIKEKWRMHELLRIKDAVAQTGAPRVAIISIEEGEALIAFVHTYGVKQVSTVESRGSGKHYAKSSGRQEFFGDCLAEFKMALQGQEEMPLVVVGPGFTKDDFLQCAKEKARGLFDKAVVDSTAHGGQLGVQEALRRGTIARVVESHRLVEEIQLVEKVFEGVANDGKATYGPKHVEAALKAGAVEVLLVADSIVREPAIDRLMEMAAEAKARAVVLSTEAEAGRRLEGLTGIAAVLKFKTA